MQESFLYVLLTIMQYAFHFVCSIDHMHNSQRAVAESRLVTQVCPESDEFCVI